MTPLQLRTCLSALDLSLQAVARRLGVNDRTVRRWAAGAQEIPEAVARDLRHEVERTEL